MTREEQVIGILKSRGHISEATGFAELGRVQVASAIWRLKNKRTDLIPAGHVIATVEKRDTQGKRYAEWQLRPLPRKLTGRSASVVIVDELAA